jgi:hypothetical protein
MPARLGLRRNGCLLALAMTLAVGRPGPAAAADEETSETESAEQPMDEKAVCAQAFEQAQRFQRDTKYLAANQELLKCANPTCGDVLFHECSKMYSELQAAIPTVVFSARDAQSNMERTDVSVSMDGQEILQQIDGRPLSVDPGSHHFTFKSAGRDPVEQEHVIRAGEKFRQITAVFEAPAPQQPASEPPVSEPGPSAPPADSGGRGVPAATYVLGGVGLVAFGAFGAFRLIGASDYNDLDETCGTDCDPADVDGVRQKYLISNIAAGVGAAALAGALVVYLAAPSESTRTALHVTPNPGGVSARVITRF